MLVGQTRERQGLSNVGGALSSSRSLLTSARPRREQLERYGVRIILSHFQPQWFASHVA